MEQKHEKVMTVRAPRRQLTHGSFSIFSFSRQPETLPNFRPPRLELASQIAKLPQRETYAFRAGIVILIDINFKLQFRVHEPWDCHQKLAQRDANANERGRKNWSADQVESRRVDACLHTRRCFLKAPHLRTPGGGGLLSQIWCVRRTHITITAVHGKEVGDCPVAVSCCFQCTAHLSHTSGGTVTEKPRSMRPASGVHRCGPDRLLGSILCSIPCAPITLCPRRGAATNHKVARYHKVAR
ncbi:hypothetical protein B0T17DRAFT_304990 [Bombardia bombarda]|uniref:Uncharacterized protein n=1 Tax=Bombardia bombarda TaxID=252184 RepID=A0AA40C1E0_9PEZI|nr:hypothetical protein B0T17DRAFT_304990 [Bombardia bombarda]